MIQFEFHLKNEKISSVGLNMAIKPIQIIDLNKGVYLLKVSSSAIQKEIKIVKK